MSGDRIMEALRALPAEKASEGFTDRVLRRMDEPPALPPRRPAWRYALAAAAVVAVLAPVGLSAWQGRRRAETERVRVAALRAEYLQLRSELATLNRMAERSEPVVYLAGDERVDFVLDLRSLAQQEAVPAAAPASARPRR